MADETTYATLIDASTEKTMPVTLSTAPKTETSEVLEMVTGRDDDYYFDNDITIGRMSNGFDVSEFDLLPRNRIYDTPNQSEGPAGDELDLLAGDDEIADIDDAGDVPQMFQPPAREQFPIFKAALRQFQADDKPKVARIDNDASYGDFVCEKAVNELSRRMDALEQAFEEHVDDPFAHRRQIKSAEVLGAAQSIADIQYAKSPDEALDAMPQIPVDLPPFAQGKVKCWKDGDYVICSMKFEAPDGNVRYASMASKPKVDSRSVESWAMQNGVDPIDILGMVDDAADVICGKRLVRDTAKAALKAQNSDEVLGMGHEPVLFGNNGADPGRAPLAALMYLQQRADAGDEQAAQEMAKIRLAAQTPSGRAIAAPLLDEANRRLSAVKQKATQVIGESGSFAHRYALMGMCL